MLRLLYPCAHGFRALAAVIAALVGGALLVIEAPGDSAAQERRPERLGPGQTRPVSQEQVAPVPPRPIGPASAPAPVPFVRVEGTRFLTGDEPFYFVGSNLNVMHGPEPRSGAAQTIAAAAADGLRVGRVWALGEGLADDPAWKGRSFLFRLGPEGWQEEAFVQLDRVIAAAKEQGLRLVITLSNSWADYGGIPMYLRWSGHKDVESYGYTDRFFTDPKCTLWFTDHVRRIVGRVNSVTGVPYRDDPTIMAWELQNEMHGTPEAAEDRRRWVVEMSRLIRGLDPNHLVVPGTIGYSLTTERQHWIAMNSLPEVSYCDQHIYPKKRLRSRGARGMRLFIDDRVQLAHHVIGKPIVFGEFGFADRGAPARRARWHRLFLEHLFYSGGNGAMVWIYQPTLPWTRTYGILVDQPRYAPVRRALGAVSQRVTRHGVVAKNPRLGPEVGTTPLAPTHAMMTRVRRAHGGWRRAEPERLVHLTPPREEPHVAKAAGPPRATLIDQAGAEAPAAPSTPALGPARVLSIPVEKFYRAWFEEAGSWDGGILVHAYGRRTGWFEYRFAGLPFVPARIALRARMSSEYPGRYGPLHGTSRVAVFVDGVEVGRPQVVADDGVGQWVTIPVDNPALLARLRGGTHTLRFQVDDGPEANGVAIYGREAELNREPVEAPGPIQIIAWPARR